MIEPSHSLRTLRTVALAAGVAALALAAAGCGGGTKAPSVASLGTTTTATTTTEANSAGGAVGNSGAQASSSGGGGTLRMVGGNIQQLTKFSACMRKNGVPSFPDPNSQGAISITGIDPGSAQFQQAQEACRKLMPRGGTPSPAQQEQARVQALAFSACMRSHGVPDFPDPQFGTGGTVRLKIAGGSGIDPGSPQFQAAQTACQKDLPGKKLGGPPSGAVGPKG